LSFEKFVTINAAEIQLNVSIHNKVFSHTVSYFYSFLL